MPGSAVFLPELVDLTRRCRIARNALSHGGLLVAVPDNNSMSLPAFSCTALQHRMPIHLRLLRTLLHSPKLNSFVFNRFRILSQKHPGWTVRPPSSHEELPFEGEENRVARPAESMNLSMSPRLSIAIRNCLTYDVRQDVSASRILLQERPKSSRPAFEILRSAKRNNYGENLFRRRRHHRSFRIARRAAVRPNRISEHRHSLQIQIVFADAFVCFAGAPRAKNNFAGHMRQVIQPDRQPALHRYEINHVHHGVDLRQAFPSNHAPQQRLRRTAVSRWIFPQSLVGHARRLHLRRRQYTAREGQFLNFVLPRLHLFEQRGGRRPRLHLRRHAAQRCSRALRFQFRINRYLHDGLSLQPVLAGPKSAARTLPGGLFRSRGTVRVCAKRPELLPLRIRCGSACIRNGSMIVSIGMLFQDFPRTHYHTA